MSNNIKSTAETAKAGKRKGTRSVSTLTPSQLARKRANDREAQRAIRARTKEHIESLEREIEELRSQRSRDQTIQNLLRRNKALEDEVRHLREKMKFRANDGSDAYQHVYHSPSPTRPPPFGPSPAGYPMMQGMTPFGNIPDATETWSSGLPCSIPSTVSSPSSSVSTEDFVGSCLPSSAPSTVFERSSMPPTTRSPTVSCISGEGNFEDVKPEFGCPQVSIVPIDPTYQYQPWNVYPMHYQTPPTGLEHGHQISPIGMCQF
ncbi:hypothetical protein AAE478_007121 [Parahypoxylon ruwenzoriense]